MDQPPALSLYSVGTRLILRFAAPHIGSYHTSRKFTHGDICSRDTMRPASRGARNHVDRGVDLVGPATECLQETGGLPPCLWLAEDAAVKHYLGVGRHHDRIRMRARHHFCFRRGGPGDVTHWGEAHRRTLIGAGWDN
jgi:hypothetical protein